MSTFLPRFFSLALAIAGVVFAFTAQAQSSTLCSQAVVNSGSGLSGSCEASCMGGKISMNDPFLCSTGTDCCYLPITAAGPDAGNDGSSSQNACAQAGIQQQGQAAACVANQSDCASVDFTPTDASNSSSLLCPENQFCCVPKADVANDAATPTSPPVGLPDTPRGALNDGRSYLNNPLGGRTVPIIIGQAVAWFGTAAGGLFFLYLLWGGVEWMTAGGNDGNVKKAQQRIVASVFGIAIVLLSYMLVSSIIGIIPQ